MIVRWSHKYHAINMYGGVEVWLHSSLGWAWMVLSGQVHAPPTLPPVWVPEPIWAYFNDSYIAFMVQRLGDTQLHLIWVSYSSDFNDLYAPKLNSPSSFNVEHTKTDFIEICPVVSKKKHDGGRTWLFSLSCVRFLQRTHKKNEEDKQRPFRSVTAPNEMHAKMAAQTAIRWTGLLHTSLHNNFIFTN
jgi:hypothetical protein